MQFTRMEYSREPLGLASTLQSIVSHPLQSAVSAGRGGRKDWQGSLSHLHARVSPYTANVCDIAVDFLNRPQKDRLS